MAGNPPSKPTELMQQWEWSIFKAPMLDKLAPGRYSLRPKTCITPQAPGIEQCSFEDQLMFSQVDDMERNMLEGVLEAKIREVNQGGNTKVMITNDNAGGVDDTGLRGKVLIIFSNPLATDKKKRKLVKDLAGLLAMAFEQILIPVTVVVDTASKSPQKSNQSTSNATGNPGKPNAQLTLMEHNYCGSGDYTLVSINQSQSR